MELGSGSLEEFICSRLSASAQEWIWQDTVSSFLLLFQRSLSELY